MKRQNSSTSDNDDHSRNTSDSNNTIYPLEMSTSPILMTPPYNRNSASHGRRRKKLYSAAAEKRDDNIVGTNQPSLIASPGVSTLPASAASGTNSPSTTSNHDAANNTTNQITTMQKSQEEDDKDTSKKLKAPNRRNPLRTMYHMLTNKLQYYRKKLSNLTPRQKLVVCTLLIVWKFIQAWLIVRGVVWLSGGSAVAVDHHHGGVNNGGKEGVSVVQVGRSLDQRMKLDGELQVEIELSRVEEDRLEERLWMDKDGHQYVRLDEEEDVRGDGRNDGMMEGIEESEVDMMAATKILYMLTVTCATQQPQFSPHASKESSITQQQRDGTTNVNDSSSKLNSSAANTNIDSLLSTLSTNIQTMITHPEGYTVDVYWMLGCAWSDYNSMLSSSASELNNNEEISEYWKEYIAQQLPNGVGLQIWEDAMPLDYSAAAVPFKDKTAGQQQQRQGRQTAHSDAQFNSSTKKGEEDHYATATLSPSIDKFMKQHRYVVRDKLDYYDVFLSFGASLQPQHPQPSSANRNSGIVELSGELVQVNGTFVQFCTKNLYRDTTISCNDRLDYLTKRYGISKNVAMVSLLKEKECICTVGGGDLEAIIPSQFLERITGDHIYTFLSMSSELNELPNGQHIIPGFLAVDAVPPTAGKGTNDFGSQQFHVDASPCCDSDSMELSVETKGGVAINADEWQMIKVVTEDSADMNEDKTKDETPSPLSEWIAVERKRKSGEGTTRPTFKFYEDGWMLTKDQLLRFDYGSNRGKFLPPFTSENSVHVHDSSMSKHSLTCPLFESKDIRGLGLRRAISLDPNEFSRQLIHPVSPLTTTASKNVSLGARELLRQFHNAEKKM
ncbi:hypothetical protein QTG54_015015 [Skeletonema marinoi]|uniref:Uncharacterized protein n=1 Tax=Skeletonema marinoi TaxID=267567 RepID=A0AAD9D638_9STRA|nr:hypothetical protein QTG54_015015 [Skeletonema marinoi]